METKKDINQARAEMIIVDLAGDGMTKIEIDVIMIDIILQEVGVEMKMMDD